jgi:hypothetical protein
MASCLCSRLANCLALLPTCHTACMLESHHDVRLPCPRACRLSGWPVGRLTGRVVGWLIFRLASMRDGRRSGSLSSRLAGRHAVRLSGWPSLTKSREDVLKLYSLLHELFSAAATALTNDRRRLHSRPRVLHCERHHDAVAATKSTFNSRSTRRCGPSSQGQFRRPAP